MKGSLQIILIIIIVFIGIGIVYSDLAPRPSLRRAVPSGGEIVHNQQHSILQLGRGFGFRAIDFRAVSLNFKSKSRFVSTAPDFTKFIPPRSSRVKR